MVDAKILKEVRSFILMPSLGYKLYRTGKDFIASSYSPATSESAKSL